MDKTYGGFLVSQIKQLQARAFEKMLRDSGVDAFNGALGRILYVLWERGRLTISEIGRLTSLAKTTLTGCSTGWRTRGCWSVPRTLRIAGRSTSSSPDRRAGTAKRMTSVPEDGERFYRGFSDNEIEAFERQLRRIIQNLEEPDKEE
jgi:DNA-binding MarR family transcriptional regulator